MEVGLRLSVGQDALGAKEVGEESDLSESREENGDSFVAEEAFTEDFDEAVTLVGDEIRRLSTLVKDFLVFARPTPPQRRPASIDRRTRLRRRAGHGAVGGAHHAAAGR